MGDEREHWLLVRGTAKSVLNGQAGGIARMACGV